MSPQAAQSVTGSPLTIQQIASRATSADTALKSRWTTFPILGARRVIFATPACRFKTQFKNSQLTELP